MVLSGSWCEGRRRAMTLASGPEAGFPADGHRGESSAAAPARRAAPLIGLFLQVGVLCRGLHDSGYQGRPGWTGVPLPLNRRRRWRVQPGNRLVGDLGRLHRCLQLRRRSRYTTSAAAAAISRGAVGPAPWSRPSRGPVRGLLGGEASSLGRGFAYLDRGVGCLVEGRIGGLVLHQLSGLPYLLHGVSRLHGSPSRRPAP